MTHRFALSKNSYFITSQLTIDYFTLNYRVIEYYMIQQFPSSQSIL